MGSEGDDIRACPRNTFIRTRDMRDLKCIQAWPTGDKVHFAE